MSQSDLQDIRNRLATKALTDEDIRYIDGLLERTGAEGLGQKIGNKRIVAHLPHGMDIIK